MDKSKRKMDKAKWLEDCWVTWVRVGFGVKQYMAFHPDFISPVGVVWIIEACGRKRKEASVIYSFVLPFFRRYGIRSLINAKLLDVYDLVTTPDGTAEGKAFMRANGYTFDKARGDWYRKRETNRRAGA